MVLQNTQILMIMNTGISLIMGFYMLFLRKTTSENGVGFWAVGSLVIGVGLALNFIPSYFDYLTIVGPSIFVSVGLYFYLAGIWEFKQKRIIKWIIIGMPLFDLIQSFVFFEVFPSVRIRSAIHSLVLIVYCLIAVFEMFSLNSNQKFLKKIFLLNALSFIIFLILLLLNLATIFSNPNYNPSNINDFGLVVHIVSGFVMIALTFGFLSAVNLQLNTDLKEQLQSKNKFFSIIAHDLRGPVGNIMNFLELLKTDSNIDEKERENYLEIVNTLSHSTFHLLQNLLDWSYKSKNLGKYENERIDLTQMVRDNIDLFRSSSAVKSIHVEFKELGGMFINGNSDMLQTILRNLVSNAIKFTPNGGNIAIDIENVNNKIRLQVIDTGVGMDQKTIRSLFSFKEAKSTKGTEGESGSGLGLPLCKEFVSNNKGEMRIESIINKGTTVIIDFPKAK